MTAPGVVYYVRFEDFVKIGTSRNLPSRLRAIPGHELLAVEPGNHATEHMRHMEFGALRFVGEWFRNDPPLSAFITHVRSVYGSPLDAYERIMREGRRVA